MAEAEECTRCDFMAAKDCNDQESCQRKESFSALVERTVNRHAWAVAAGERAWMASRLPFSIVWSKSRCGTGDFAAAS